MKEGSELHVVDQGLSLFINKFIGYHWLGDYAMQVLGLFIDIKTLWSLSHNNSQQADNVVAPQHS